MVFEINNLIASEHKMLKRLGWLLYEREHQNGGLTADETEKLLEIVNDNEANKIYQAGYDEGLNDGLSKF